MMRLLFGIVFLSSLSNAHGFLAKPADGLFDSPSQQVISVKILQLLQMPAIALTAEDNEQNGVSAGGAKSEMVRSKASAPKNSTSSFFWLVGLAVFLLPLIAIIMFAYVVFRIVKAGARAGSSSADSESISTPFSSSNSFDSSGFSNSSSSDSSSSDSGSSDSGSSDGGGSSSSWD